jgi:MYXO-CTERM domain-containing protein
MELKAIKALTAAALLATATAATAGTAPFNMVSGPSTAGIDVSLTVQQSATPGYDYDFVVSNSSLMGVVTGVYFEVDWNSLLSGAGASQGNATLAAGSATPDIPGWEGTKASHTTQVQRVRVRQGRFLVDHWMDNLGHGIQEGDSQVFSFAADTSEVSLADLESMLGTDGYGVAIRMQGLTQDQQAAGWGEAAEREEEVLLVETIPTGQGGEEVEVTAAPSPTAGLAGLAILGLAGLRRRRRD